MKKKEKETSAGDGSGGADWEKNVGGERRGRGSPTVGRFEHCARLHRGVAPVGGCGPWAHAAAPCAQRLIPGRGCGWAPGG